MTSAPNTVDMLNSRFSIRGHLAFREAPGGLSVVEIDNPLATATVCLQGAHLMSWRPKSETQPVVWLSPLAKLAPGKSIRGGVPVCWPWFGPHATDSKLPGHGYARTVPWELTEARALPDGATVIGLTLVESEATRAQWSQRARCTIRITVGRTLQIALVTENLGNEDCVIGEALHTYFQIGDIAETRVFGLEGVEYLDKVSGNARRRQDGALMFAGETDRVYVNTESECTIEDPRLKRRIVVAKSGSRSTVVWTPWAEKADKMGDFGPDGWRAMVCVESANALENVVTVKPGNRHTLSVEYRAEKL
jgi:D-hexose-6-phosphate mutarotase